jgi:hypothetical protein
MTPVKAICLRLKKKRDQWERAELKRLCLDPKFCGIAIHTFKGTFKKTTKEKDL